MQTEIRQAIEKALASLGAVDVDFEVGHPTDDSVKADYTTNVCMKIFAPISHSEKGKVYQWRPLIDQYKKPNELAEKLQILLEPELSFVEKIEVAGPGFLNFYLGRNFFTEKIATIQEQGNDWGKNDSWAGKKVIVEYTDPNPFKEFHVGHLFTNAVGESIARLFMVNGADTKRVNYQGDVGLHVAHAIYGMKHYGITPDKAIFAKDLGRAYALGATTYKIDEQAMTEIREINRKIYSREDEEINALYDAGRRVSLAYFETIYALVDTKFDEYFFESEAGPKGKELVESHPAVFKESDGVRVFNGEEYGLHTRVFLNKEGLPTYEAKELALAKMKEERLGGYDWSVISTGSEINEYFKVLKRAMRFVYPELAEKTEHIGHGMVRLTTGKMSSRTGDVIPAIDFIQEVAGGAFKKMEETRGSADMEIAIDVAIAAIKYTTLKGSILQDSIFDKDRALSFEGDSGPYLQYTHARICSLLTKATEVGIGASLTVVPSEAYAVEKLVYQFPEVVVAGRWGATPRTR
jgi:arginyl-tRNA synthetase